MRRNDPLDFSKTKKIAEQKYAERKINKWIKWSWDIKGRINYKQLKQKQDEYGIRAESWRKNF